jgi:hypothetical protein
MAKLNGISYIRTTRAKTPVIYVGSQLPRVLACTGDGEPQYELWRTLPLLPAVELLLGVGVLHDVANQEAVVRGAVVHGLHV